MSDPADDDALDRVRGRGMPGSQPLGPAKPRHPPAHEQGWHPHPDPRFEVDDEGHLRTRIDRDGRPMPPQRYP